VLLGWTGLVLSTSLEMPPHRIHRSAALVAILKKYQGYFATLPII